MIHDLFTLAMLVLLQAVLGFDNLLYISMESKRVDEADQVSVRRIGVSLAIILRIVLLFVLIKAIEYFKDPFVDFDTKAVGAAFSVHSLIVLGGGAFIIYTAVKEIFHMLMPHALEGGGNGEKRTKQSAIFWIVVMNLVFSFDSILSAIALTKTFWVMAAAIVISGGMMIWLSDHVTAFLQKNRMYEVLGLFILFIVGIMLLSEGGHLAKLHFFSYHVEPMAKSTFYFVIGVLVIVDIVQSKYRKKLLAQANYAAQAQPAQPS